MHYLHQMIATVIQLFNTGNFDEAEKILSEILKNQPKNFDALHMLGVIKGTKNLHQEALEYFKKALRISPNNSLIHFNIAKAFSEIGENEKAIKYFLSSTSLNPNDPDLWLSYGKTLSTLNRVKDALNAFENALEINPNFAEAWSNKGVALDNLNLYDEALISFDKALLINSQFATAWFNRGNTFLKIKQYKQSISSYDTAVSINPQYVEAWYSLGNALLMDGQYEQSIASYDNALKINPRFAEAWSNRGNALLKIKIYAQSIASFEKALEISPLLAEAWLNRGNALVEIKKYELSLASYEKALEVNPQLAEAWSNRGYILINLCQFKKAEASYREAIRLDPELLTARSDRLFNMNYLEALNLEEAVSEAKIYGSKVSSKSIPKFANWNVPFDNEKIRIGFVSGDLANHPVGYFLESLVEFLDPSQFELYAFPTRSLIDDLTHRIKPFFTEWTPIYDFSDFDAAKVIHQKGIHILFDLSGHSAYNRLPVFSYKPARVQVSWLGYFATTGLPEMDYFLGDIHMSPDTEANHFTESIWKLPETWLCLKPHSLGFSNSELPAIANGFVTFGSLGNLSKMNDQVVATWASLLHKIPKSKLLLKSKQLADVSQIDMVQKRFGKLGIPKESLILEGPTAWDAYLKAYRRVDIVLDTFPYPGGTTSIDALCMGVPVLTVKGDRFLSRLGQSIAINAGNLDWIANDLNDYVKKAVEFSSDLERLVYLRSTLRARVLKSPLFDTNRFAKNFSDALWGMWLQSTELKC